MPLGLVREALSTVRLPLATIQAFCLYSDGVVEARDPAGAMFGFPRLQQACTARRRWIKVADCPRRRCPLRSGQQACRYLLGWRSSWSRMI